MSDLKLLGIDVESIRDQIIENVSSEIVERIEGDIRKSVGKRVDAVINKNINKVVEKELSEKYQPINDYGESQGEMTTIRSQFKKAVQEWWRQKVDDEGRISDGYNTKWRYEWIAQKVIGDVLTVQLKNKFNKLIELSKEQLKQGIAETISKIVDRQFK